MTFDDARMYTKPFTIKFTEALEADYLSLQPGKPVAAARTSEEDR